jgi:parallel beta-helix repeat protein
VTISGFEISNGSSGIFVSKDYSATYENLTITENIIVSNEGYGINIRETSNSVISNNVIEHNYRYYWSGIGIYIGSYWGRLSHHNEIIGNVISSNGEIGIFINPDSYGGKAMSTYNTIEGNTILNHSDTGLRIDEASNNLVEGNEFDGNSYGILFEGSNNTINNNEILSSYYGIRMGL